MSLQNLTILVANNGVVPNYEIAMDPQIYPDPERFDPLRFEKLRQDPAWANKSQFVSSNPQSLSFGYGRHACPG